MGTQAEIHGLTEFLESSCTEEGMMSKGVKIMLGKPKETGLFVTALPKWFITAHN